MQSERKKGIQIHIHVTVSAGDAEQKIALTPLSTPDRFNRLQFSAKAVAKFKIQFGRMGNRDLMKPEPTRKQLIAQKAEEITIRTAANKREEKSLIVEQPAIKNARLDTQVARFNSKLDASQQLNPEQVEAAMERSCDDVFCKKLTKIERNAKQGSYTRNPYTYLTTGQVSRSGKLMFDESDLPHPPPTYPLREQEPEILRGSTHALAQTIERLSQALVPASETQDVPSEVKSKDEPSKPGLTRIVNQLSQAMTPMSKTQDVCSEVERDDDYELD